MPQEAKAGPQKRGLYQRTEDEDIFLYTGKFGLITANEIASLAGRNVVSLRKRLRTLFHADIIGRVVGGEQREEFFQAIVCAKCGHENQTELTDGRIRPKPNFHFLLPKGAAKASSLLAYPIAWKSKAISRVDHDRVISTIHLSLHHAFGVIITDWRQMKQDVKITVELRREKISFYPDAAASFAGTPLWLEYANSEPSSANGVNDIVEKVERYNEILKHQDGKVIFVFRERAMVENFVNRLSADFPYLWIYATDLESITTRPKEKIFYTPKDFDRTSHSLTELAS